jgi:undecaprenol kinase
MVGLLMGGMLTTECLNTAIEATVDLICGDNPYRLAKAAKDLAAGACLLWALTSVVVGLIIFWPKIVIIITP